MKSFTSMSSVLAIVASSAVASAQPSVSPLRGQSFEVAGTTSLSFGRQTVTQNGDSAGGNLDTVSLTGGLVYYLTPMVGIGAIGTYQRLALPIPDSSDSIEASASGIGPAVRVRFPLTDRSAFHILGSVGYASLHLQGGGEAGIEGDTSGPFYSAGAGFDLFVLDNVALNVGVVYQKSNFSRGSDKLDALGLTGAVGFSVYLPRR